MPKHIDSITITINHDNCEAKAEGYFCDWNYTFNLKTSVADNFIEEVSKAIREIVIKYSPTD